LISYPMHSIGYEINFDDLSSHEKFQGHMGLFKWVVFMNTANLVMGRPLFRQAVVMDLMRHKPSKILLKHMNIYEWNKVFINNWFHVLKLDAYICHRIATDSICDIAGNENQLKLAKMIGIKHLSTLYSYINNLGYQGLLNYSNIREKTISVDIFNVVLELLKKDVPENRIFSILKNAKTSEKAAKELISIRDDLKRSENEKT
jgi:hypothetical protein